MTAPQQLGPYRIVRPLGQGGMGAVYEAVQEPIGRRVALKVLLPQYAQDHDAVTRFFNEARAVNLIEHPSIVQVSDYAQVPDGTVYLVMEYLRGQTLSDRIDGLQRQGQRVPLREVVQLAAQLADALSAAHDKSVIHRDLKPSNVMLVPDPAVPGGSRVKLLDFGIAKLARNEGRGTATHDVFGTPQYMSPEQCAGAGGVDARTDVYALGVMMFEMLAGRLPFLAETPLEYMGQHAFKPPPPLADLAPHAPAELVALVQRMLVKDRQARPAMRQVAEELARLQAAVSAASGTLAADSLSAPVTSLAADGLNEGKGALGPRAAGPPSTLGNSLGQPLRRKQKTRQVLLISSLVAVVGLVALGLNLGRHTSAPGPLPASPDLAPLSLQPAVAEPKPAAPNADTPSPTTQPVVSATAEASKPHKPKTNKPAAASRPAAKPKPSAAATPAKPPVVAAPPPPEMRPVRRED